MNWKPWEPLGHKWMGAIAMLTNTRYQWLTKREMGQLPPENDRYPVLYVHTYADGARSVRKLRSHGADDEYWAAIRVMDTLTDLADMDLGGQRAWPVLVALCFSAGLFGGWMLRGAF
jgi:hypothetical protein